MLLHILTAGGFDVSRYVVLVGKSAQCSQGMQFLTLGTVEDKDDVLIENLSTVLFLVLGGLALFASVLLSVNVVTMAVAGVQLLSGLLFMSIFAILSCVLGLSFVHLFRKRRRVRREKESSPFYSSH